MQANTLLICTRKGLFVAQETTSGYAIASTHFLGDPVTLSYTDPRDGTWYAALDHGHFGAKLHRSKDQGSSWTEIATPVFPEKPADSSDPLSWNLRTIWALTSAGNDRPGALWCGSIPGGLFYSNTAGDSWELCESLWNHPDRLRWFGGGSDTPGMHSVLVDPRNSDRILVCCVLWWNLGKPGRWEELDRAIRGDAR